MTEQQRPQGNSAGSSRGLIIGLMLVIVAAAFAVGVGITGLLDDDATIVTARTLRSASDTEDARVSTTVVTDDRDSRFNLLDEVYEILNTEFVEPDRIDLDAIRVAAIDGVVESLNDPHSVYIDEETFRLSSEDISGAFEGIGATVQMQGDEIVISGTFRGSPAEGAGIRSGDAILEVDGESTAGWSLQLAVSVIRGERGTPVDITVRHLNDEIETITIIRDRIIVPSVQSFQILDRDGNAVTDIAFVLISQYTARTRTELIPFLEATKERGAQPDHHRLARQPGRSADRHGRHDRRVHRRRPGADRGRPPGGDTRLLGPERRRRNRPGGRPCWSMAAPRPAPR